MKKRIKPKYLLLGSLCAIALVFLATAWMAYGLFKQDFVRNEFDNQRKMTRIVSQSLNRYFSTLKYVVENSVMHPSFSVDRSDSENAVRFKNVPKHEVERLLDTYGINKVLTGPRSAKARAEAPKADLKYWQIFKALPEKADGKVLAEDRRTIARNILKALPDVHYAFEMDTNGDLVFLEPFDTQKNITSFNYDFRDYLRLAKSARSTVVSEGYISHDRDRTQIITVATPIFDRTNQVKKVFAVSVSAVMLRERVFRALKEQMDIQDGTTFYLVDRHGHIVASSSGKNIYFPIEDVKHDDNDSGNLRNVGFFKDIDWTHDVLEQGNIWERQTRSWQFSSLKKDFTGVYQNLNGEEVFGTFFPISIIGSDALNWGILIETPTNMFITSETYLKKVFYTAGAALILIILGLSFLILRSFSGFESQILDKEKEIATIAAQVAHDIRSPLAALSIVVEKSSGLPESERLLVRSATNRIQDIANDLISKNLKILKALRINKKPTTSVPKSQQTAKAEPKEEAFSKQLLSSLINEVVTEKRIQWRSRIGLSIETEFEPGSYGLFSTIQAGEFKRVLSNLINNAVEAIPGSGGIMVTLKVRADQAIVEIRDTGIGIAAEILPRLTERGATFGKPNGNGLGLYHAKQNIESWNGKLEISSVIDQGTTVSVKLPKVAPPAWFVPKLELTSNATVVILDDDTSIHQIWKERFASMGVDSQALNILHFSTAVEAQQWVSTDPMSHLSTTIFLFDHELIGQSQTGLDLIEKFGLSSRAILVTSHTEEREIMARCIRAGVRLIPKIMAGFVPIEVQANARKHVALSTQIESPTLLQ